MSYAGLDFSILYPTLCIKKDNDFKFISLIRDKKFKIQIFNEDYKNYFEIKILENYNKIDKIKDAEFISNEILKILKENNIKKVFIENFSYQSAGFFKEDLIGYQYILRYFLKKNNILFEVFAPRSIKKFIKNGNLNKVEIFDYILNNKEINLKLKDFLLKNVNILRNKNSIKKPIDDIIDSYFILMFGLNSEKY